MSDHSSSTPPRPRSRLSADSELRQCPNALVRLTDQGLLADVCGHLQWTELLRLSTVDRALSAHFLSADDSPWRDGRPLRLAFRCQPFHDGHVVQVQDSYGTCPQLLQLTLDDCAVDALSSVAAADIFEGWMCLRSDGRTVKDDDVQPLVAPASRMLHSLRFCRAVEYKHVNDYVENGLLAGLVTALPSLSCLRVLRLHLCLDWTRGGLSTGLGLLGHVLPQLHSLRALHVEGSVQPLRVSTTDGRPLALIQALSSAMEARLLECTLPLQWLRVVLLHHSSSSSPSQPLLQSLGVGYGGSLHEERGAGPIDVARVFPRLQLLRCTHVAVLQSLQLSGCDALLSLEVSHVRLENDAVLTSLAALRSLRCLVLHVINTQQGAKLLAPLAALSVLTSLEALSLNVQGGGGVTAAVGVGQRWCDSAPGDEWDLQWLDALTQLTHLELHAPGYLTGTVLRSMRLLLSSADAAHPQPPQPAPAFTGRVHELIVALRIEHTDQSTEAAEQLDVSAWTALRRACLYYFVSHHPAAAEATRRANCVAQRRVGSTRCVALEAVRRRRVDHRWRAEQRIVI